MHTQNYCMSGESCYYCCVHYGGMRSRSGCVISSKLIWSEGAAVSPGSLMSDSLKISMKDVLHLLSADTNPIYRRYEVTLCLHMAWTVFPRSTLTEIKTRTCCPHSAISYSCLCGVCCDNTVFCFSKQVGRPLTFEKRKKPIILLHIEM